MQLSQILFYFLISIGTIFIIAPCAMAMDRDPTMFNFTHQDGRNIALNIDYVTDKTPCNIAVTIRFLKILC